MVYPMVSAPLNPALGVYVKPDPKPTTMPCAGVATATTDTPSRSGSKSFDVVNTFTAVPASVRATSSRATGGEAAEAIDTLGKVTAIIGATTTATATSAVEHTKRGRPFRLNV